MKTAIITGGARGMGFEIAKTLFNDGYCISIIDVAAENTALENLLTGGIEEEKLLYFSGSITDTRDRSVFLNKTLDKFGRIDVLVNNAGIAPAQRQDILDMTEESFDRVMNVNVKGTLAMSQIVARQMISQPSTNGKRGVIINISSISAYTTSINRGEYCISKAGISMITKLFADRLANEEIRVFEIRPGIIATDMTAPVKEKYDTLIEGGLLPISRWGTPKDIANMVSLFCDDRFSYSTGDIINVDGGFHIQRL